MIKPGMDVTWCAILKPTHWFFGRAYIVDALSGRAVVRDKTGAPAITVRTERLHKVDRNYRGRFAGGAA